MTDCEASAHHYGPDPDKPHVPTIVATDEAGMGHTEQLPGAYANRADAVAEAQRVLDQR